MHHAAMVLALEEDFYLRRSRQVLELWELFLLWKGEQFAYPLLLFLTLALKIHLSGIYTETQRAFRSSSLGSMNFLWGGIQFASPSKSFVFKISLRSGIQLPSFYSSPKFQESCIFRRSLNKVCSCFKGEKGIGEMKTVHSEKKQHICQKSMLHHLCIIFRLKYPRRRLSLPFSREWL